MPRRPLLTAQQVKVLRRIARGWTALEVALDLFISEDTVKTHLRRIYKKLGAMNAPQAVAIAYTRGIFTRDELHKSLKETE